MNRKKVLITGITGFAGSHLAELLSSESEFEVYGTHISDRQVDNLAGIKDKIKLFKVNLLESEEVNKVVAEILPDVVYHLAASTNVADSFKNPSEVLVNNISSEVNLLEALRRNNLLQTRVVIISSAHVYGLVDISDLPIDENVSFKPDNPYSVSKIAQDYLGLSYFLAYKMPIIRLRPFNHIGPRLSPGISVSRFAKSIADIEKGKSEPVLKVGNLEARRDFTDVRDMVNAYLLASENCTPGEEYNIGTGKSYTIKEILDQLLTFSKTEIRVESDISLFRPSDVPELRCNPAKFKQATKWNPEVKIEQTLLDLLDYWRKVV